MMEGSSSVAFAILTVSDRCFNKESVDQSGPALAEAIEKNQLGIVLWKGLAPDECKDVGEKIRQCCDTLEVNVLLTTGGTGLAKRDVTPDATEPLMHRLIPSFSTKLVLDGLQSTPFAILSRGIVGIRNKTLVINLPGSPKGAIEGLNALAPVIPHAVDLILGRKFAVASSHGEIPSKTTLIKSKVVVNTSEISRLRCSKWPMVEMTDVPKILTNNVKSLPLIKVKSTDAVGCILGIIVKATENLPKERTSMKDGYVLFNKPLIEENDMLSTERGYTDTYKVVGEYRPGENDAIKEINADRAVVKVSTGSCVPKYAYCVVPVEDTVPSESASSIRLANKSYALGEDIRAIGCDIKEGDTVLEEGALIGPAEVGVLATVSQSEISVVRLPVVAVVSTGDELQEPWIPAEHGKIRDCNRPVLIKLLQKWGFRTVDLHIARDDPDLILTALRSGFDSADVVISTGGMSMGERDLLKEILQLDLQAFIHFGRLRMKPGKPTGFASLYYKGDLKYWFGLPGNPASAFVTAYLVVLPALRLLSGWTKNIFLKRIFAELECYIKNDPERVEFLRGVLSTEDKEGNVLPTPAVNTTGTLLQQSSCIKGCSVANCLIEVPSGKEAVKVKDRVIVHLLP